MPHTCKADNTPPPFPSLLLLCTSSPRRYCIRNIGPAAHINTDSLVIESYSLIGTPAPNHSNKAGMLTDNADADAGDGDDDDPYQDGCVQRN